MPIPHSLSARDYSAMASRLAVRLAGSPLSRQLPAGHILHYRSYAIASSAAKPWRATAASQNAKLAVKTNTYATTPDRSAEAEAFQAVTGAGAGAPAASAPSSKAANGTAATEDPFPSPSSLEGTTENGTTDWSRSYQGLGAQPFPKEAADILLAPIDPLDVEMKPGTRHLTSQLCKVLTCTRTYRRPDLPP